MKSLRFVMSLRKAYGAFRKELAVSRDEPYPEYNRFLKALGFDEFISHVVTACVMYPFSIDACKDCVTDLSHSLHDPHKFRLSNSDTERLRRLIDLAGNEIFSILEPHGFFNIDPITSRSVPIYDDVVGIPDVTMIGESTFVVVVNEYRDCEYHTDLSNKTFGSYDPTQWSH